MLVKRREPAEPAEEALAAQAPALGPYTKAGSTASFDVYYDTSLGANGQNLAGAVLANCEADLFALRGWFGGRDPATSPSTSIPGRSAPITPPAPRLRSTARPSARPIPPDAAARAANRLDVFATGTDSALWHRGWG